MSLDAATLALVAGELKNTLLDAKIDKIFEPTRDEVLMTLRTRTETHRLLLSARSGSARRRRASRTRSRRRASVCCCAST